MPKMTRAAIATCVAEAWQEMNSPREAHRVRPQPKKHALRGSDRDKIHVVVISTVNTEVTRHHRFFQREVLAHCLPSKLVETVNKIHSQNSTSVGPDMRAFLDMNPHIGEGRGRGEAGTRRDPAHLVGAPNINN